MGNGAVPNPDGWGLLIGGSAFRRFDFGKDILVVPELFAAYDMQATTWHSTASDAAASGRPGQVTNYVHSARVLVRGNVGFRSDKTTYTVVPYLGYQDGLALGGTVGAVF
jgi:hypothetical protein